ncbi:hypothetical protein ACFYY1_37245 [Streptomyces sp. NPDC001890]|uniref:hypothetical protein n=1 Tax=Streptomyces sp. NPDC001890 TaxID=3364620 RepID=UPI0036B808DF
MQSIDGRQWATQEELVEHSNYGRVASLANLWHDREVNGHPPARVIDGVPHWDLETWTQWLAEHHEREPRDGRGIDRTGDPDEQLPPAGQARVLGVDISRITQYAKTPPRGWPDPIRIEKLPTRTREYRTRAQLWEFADDPDGGFGTSGGRPVGSRTKEKAPDPRVQQAAEMLAAHPDMKVGEVATLLAERHGQAVITWKRVITRARKGAQQ